MLLWDSCVSIFSNNSFSRLILTSIVAVSRCTFSNVKPTSDNQVANLPTLLPIGLRPLVRLPSLLTISGDKGTSEIKKKKS